MQTSPSTPLCPRFPWAAPDGSHALRGARSSLACWASAFLHTPVHCAHERCPPTTSRVNAHGCAGAAPGPPSPPARTVTAASLTGLPTATLTHPSSEHTPLPHSRTRSPPRWTSHDVAHLPLQPQFPHLRPFPSQSGRLSLRFIAHTRLTPTLESSHQLLLLQVRLLPLSGLSTPACHHPITEVLWHNNISLAFCLPLQVMCLLYS